jgi:hypothetical protein
MKITIEPTEQSDPAAPPNCLAPVVTISLPSDDLTVEDVMENLVIPALLASGYQKATIDAYLSL